jgi:RNA polymerase sigma factor (sigma-70 family)
MSSQGRNGACTDAPDASPRRSPEPGDVFAAAVELATSGAGAFRRTARRYSICSADADDAYQRSLEILLTKAPTTDRSQLRPWLHTVIKHEALALRRQRERTVAPDDTGAEEPIASDARDPEESAGERERLRQTAEALGTLKPSEVQCMILKALGYSYDEISQRTGFSWTKVNRSLTEGRRRFLECFGEISSGQRCERFLPLLSAVCDGHASDQDERTTRAHLSSCPGCRAALRAYRSGPARLAELVPPSVVLPLLDRASVWSRFTDWVSSGGGERAGALGAKLQQGAEMAGAQKAAAVVASTAALAGGGAAVHEQVRALPEREQPARAERQLRPDTAKPIAEVQPAEPAPAPPEPAKAEVQEEAAQTAAETAAGEFGPERASAEADVNAASATAPDTPVEREQFAGAGAGSTESPSSAGGGEFGP